MPVDSNTIKLRIQQLNSSDKELFLEYKEKYKNFLYPIKTVWPLTDYEMKWDCELHRFFTIDEWNTLQYEKTPAANLKTGTIF